MNECYNLNINKLFLKFPGFIFRDGCAELIGYNPKTHIHMVISDGLCISEDKKWLIHQYKIKNPDTFDWLKWKYIVDENIAKCIFEEWVEL